MIAANTPGGPVEIDHDELNEWLDSLDYVLESGGKAKVQELIRRLTHHLHTKGVRLPFTANTPYINRQNPQTESSLQQGSLWAGFFHKNLF